MDEKISLEAIANYGNGYANKVLARFFGSKDQITGKEILSLCNIQQINLFVVRELFRSWKEETRRQRSVYFDNEHPEVKEALSNYMAVLSNHILIDREHFEPLLKKAVSHTLMMVFDPYDFFSLLISGRNNTLDVASFREEIKYIKVNREPLDRMLQKLEEKNVREIPGNEAFAILDQILEEVNFSPDDLEEYIQKFNEVLPLDPNSFFVPKAENVRKVESQKPVVVEAPAVTRPSTESVSKASLNDQLVSVRKPALADNLGKIARIKENLSINQKFMFTKELFFGDFESFSRAIDDLDQLPDLKSAIKYLERHSSNWDRESREFHEFMELVEKRFS